MNHSSRIYAWRQGHVNVGSARVANPRTLSFGAGSSGFAARTCAKEKILGEAPKGRPASPNPSGLDFDVALTWRSLRATGTAILRYNSGAGRTCPTKRH